jgi:hypothetical protein
VQHRAWSAYRSDATWQAREGQQSPWTAGCRGHAHSYPSLESTAPRDDLSVPGATSLQNAMSVDDCHVGVCGLHRGLVLQVPHPGPVTHLPAHEHRLTWDVAPLAKHQLRASGLPAAHPYASGHVPVLIRERCAVPGKCDAPEREHRDQRECRGAREPRGPRRRVGMRHGSGGCGRRHRAAGRSALICLTVGSVETICALPLSSLTLLGSAARVTLMGTVPTKVPALIRSSVEPRRSPFSTKPGSPDPRGSTGVMCTRLVSTAVRVAA